jgi:hypothetical protein
MYALFGRAGSDKVGILAHPFYSRQSFSKFFKKFFGGG